MAYTYYRSVTLLEAQAGASDSSNFPVTFTGTYAYLATVANGGKVENANGYDIAFFSDSALTTALDFELVQYTATTGFLEAHVRVPTLSSSTDTVIYLAYGDSGISTYQGDTAGTWNSNYTAVYHCGDGSSVSTTDSSGTGNTLSVYTGTPTGAAGKVGGAHYYGGSAAHIVSSLTGGPQLSGPYTASFWVKHDNSTSEERLLFSLVKDNSGGAGVSTDARKSGTNHDLKNWGGGTAASFGALTQTSWNLLHFVCTTGGSTEVFVNGVSTATGTTGGTGAVGTLGVATFNNAYPTPYHLGHLDEIRVRTSTVSDDWVTAEYNNQSNPSTFYTMGSEVGGGTDYTLSAASGSFTLTGTAANLEFGRKLAASGGSFALTGTAANLEFGRKLTATGGTYALTGTASSGTYTLTGTAAGTLTFSGALVKTTSKAATGALIFSGALVRDTSRAVAASLSPTGALQRFTNRAVSGSLTPAGALVTGLAYNRSADGALTPTGALVATALRGVTGELSFQATLARTMARSTAGSLSFAGALQSNLAISKATAGVLSFGGDLVTQYNPPPVGGGGALQRTQD